MRIAFAILALLTACTAAEAESARQACMADYRKYCAAVQPGGGRIKQCLTRHRAQLSEPCRAALDARMKRN